MKTAISISDDLLKDVDETARVMGLSRSRLFALAAADFMERRRQAEMLRQLNEVYSSVDPTERRSLKGIKAKVRRTVKERW